MTVPCEIMTFCWLLVSIHEVRSPWKYYNESQICVPCYMQTSPVCEALVHICIANLRNKGLLHVDDTGQLCASKWAPYKNSRSRTYAKGCKVTQLSCLHELMHARLHRLVSLHSD